jgi:excisionase family DNA binding protein
MKNLGANKYRTILKDYPDALRTQDICKALRISKQTAYKLITQKQIVARKIGRQYIILKTALIDYITDVSS